MNPVMKMEQIMESYIVTFKSDVIHDGIIIGRYGVQEPFLWLVRQSGTDIFCLHDITEKDFVMHFVDRCRRMFIMQNVYSDLDNGGVFFEIEAQVTPPLRDILSPNNNRVTAYQASRSIKIERDRETINYDRVF